MKEEIWKQGEDFKWGKAGRMMQREREDRRIMQRMF